MYNLWSKIIIQHTWNLKTQASSSYHKTLSVWFFKLWTFHQGFSSWSLAAWNLSASTNSGSHLSPTQEATAAPLDGWERSLSLASHSRTFPSPLTLGTSELHKIQAYQKAYRLSKLLFWKEYTGREGKGRNGRYQPRFWSTTPLLALVSHSFLSTPRRCFCALPPYLPRSKSAGIHSTTWMACLQVWKIVGGFCQHQCTYTLCKEMLPFIAHAILFAWQGRDGPAIPGMPACLTRP